MPNGGEISADGAAPMITLIGELSAGWLSCMNYLSPSACQAAGMTGVERWRSRYSWHLSAGFTLAVGDGDFLVRADFGFSMKTSPLFFFIGKQHPAAGLWEIPGSFDRRSIIEL
jgi:hypothetical protein